VQVHRIRPIRPKHRRFPAQTGKVPPALESNRGNAWSRYC